MLKADSIQIGEIRDALKWNRKVKELVINDMVITSEIMRAIAGLLQFSMSIERIHFSYCQFVDAELLRDIVPIIEKNRIFRDVIIHSKSKINKKHYYLIAKSMLENNPKLSVEIKDMFINSTI